MNRRLSAVVSRLPLAGGRRTGVVIVIAGVIALIGIVDTVTGANITFGIFYLIPVAVATVVVGTTAGVALAGMSAFLWVAADAINRSPSPVIAVHVTNFILRDLTLLTVVSLLAALRSALDDANAAERRSREFLAFAAHQLRTPVAGARAAAEALVISGAPPEQERLLRHITEECARSGRLVASLLQVARLDRGDLPEQRPADIAALVQNEAERVRTQAPHLDVQVTIDPSMPRVAAVRDDAIREPLANLLENASRHASRAVAIAATTGDGNVIIRVRDDGGGVPSGAEERIFERFVSLDGRGGPGLGLAIARGLAERDGGSLVYDGTAFVLRVPFETARSDQNGPRTRSV